MPHEAGAPTFSYQRKMEEFEKNEIADRLANMGRSGIVSVEDYALFLHDARFPVRFYDVMLKALDRCGRAGQGHIGRFELLARIIDQMEEEFPGTKEYADLREQLTDLEFEFVHSGR